MKKWFYPLLLLFTLNATAQTDSIPTIILGGVPGEPAESSLFRKAPPQPAKNMLYAELLGNGFAYSLNYERLLYNDEKLGLLGRIGIAPGLLNIFKGFGLPLEVNANFLRSPKGHMAEAGAGFTWFYGKSRFRNEKREIETTPFYNVCDINLRIGYKYSQPGGGFLFRAGFIPVFAVVSPEVVRNNDFFPFGKTFTPWAGLSVGYAFRN